MGLKPDRMNGCVHVPVCVCVYVWIWQAKSICIKRGHFRRDKQKEVKGIFQFLYFDNEVLPLQITNQTREVIINYTKYGQKGCEEKEHDENDTWITAHPVPVEWAGKHRKSQTQKQRKGVGYCMALKPYRKCQQDSLRGCMRRWLLKSKLVKGYKYTAYIIKVRLNSQRSQI